MSHCWCKCEAGLGQCGPKVPKLKTLFNAHKNFDEASLRRGDRQAELQVIWEVRKDAFVACTFTIKMTSGCDDRPLHSCTVCV